MKTLNYTILIILISLSIGTSLISQECCSKAKAIKTEDQTSLSQLAASEYNLIDQNGNQVKLNDLIKNKVVVMNFVFTSCKTICPPMGANFSALKEKLVGTSKDQLAMISISIDPATDTPERLNAWQKNFDANEDQMWTMLTGEKSTVDQLLKDLKVFTPLIDEHAPIIIMGDAADNNWIRTNGLASPEVLAEKVNQYLTLAEEKINNEADRAYFTDTELVDHNGNSLKLYSDLMQDKIVFINPFFAECPGSCPIMHTMMQEVQKHLGDRLGESVLMLSITVDPLNDTPEKLKEYAARYNPNPGWHFLSGSAQNVINVNKKLGKHVDAREDHDTVILIGNVKTKLWKKTNGLANVKEIIEVLDSVINDTGDAE